MNNHQSHNNNRRSSTLWVGDLDPEINEEYLHSVFGQSHPIQHIHIYKDKMSNGRVNYAFLEFESSEIAEQVMNQFKGTEKPRYGRPFKINWGNPRSKRRDPGQMGAPGHHMGQPPAMFGGGMIRGSRGPPQPNFMPQGPPRGFGMNPNYGYGGRGFQPMYRPNPMYPGYNPRGMPHGREGFDPNQGRRLYQKRNFQDSGLFSLYVGNLHHFVEEKELLDLFQNRYESVKSVKIILDYHTKVKKGYSFVHFENEEEMKRALQEMDGFVINGKPIKTGRSFARISSSGRVDTPGGPPHLRYGNQMQNFMPMQGYQNNRMGQPPMIQGNPQIGTNPGQSSNPDQQSNPRIQQNNPVQSQTVPISNVSASGMNQIVNKSQPARTDVVDYQKQDGLVITEIAVKPNPLAEQKPVETKTNGQAPTQTQPTAQNLQAKPLTAETIHYRTTQKNKESEKKEENKKDKESKPTPVENKVETEKEKTKTTEVEKKDNKKGNIDTNISTKPKNEKEKLKKILKDNNNNKNLKSNQKDSDSDSELIEKRVLSKNTSSTNLKNKKSKNLSQNNLKETVKEKSESKPEKESETKPKTKEVTEPQKKERKEVEKKAEPKTNKEKSNLEKLTDVVLGKRANLDEA